MSLTLWKELLELDSWAYLPMTELFFFNENFLSVMWPSAMAMSHIVISILTETMNGCVWYAVWKPAKHMLSWSSGLLALIYTKAKQKLFLHLCFRVSPVKVCVKNRSNLEWSKLNWNNVDSTIRSTNFYNEQSRNCNGKAGLLSVNKDLSRKLKNTKTLHPLWGEKRSAGWWIFEPEF